MGSQHFILALQVVYLLIQLFLLFFMFQPHPPELLLVLTGDRLYLFLIELLSEGLVLAIPHDDGLVELSALHLFFLVFADFAGQQFDLLPEHVSFSVVLFFLAVELSGTCLTYFLSLNTSFS